MIRDARDLHGKQGCISKKKKKNVSLTCRTLGYYSYYGIVVLYSYSLDAFTIAMIFLTTFIG